VRLLHSGAEFFPALERAIDGAVESIAIETYIFHDDPSGLRIANAIAGAAARGVRVRVVVDGFGTGAPQGMVGAVLAAAPLELRVFRPLSRWRLGRQALRRLHRKLALIDDTTLFVGGINLIDDHVDPVRGVLDSPRLDFAMAVRGPLVEDAARTMRRVWRRSHGSTVPPSRQPSRFTQRPLVPMPPRVDTVRATPAPSDAVVAPAEATADTIALATQGVRAAFAERDNWRNRRTIERAYLRAMGQARKDIIIACAYFFPGAKFRRALAEAAARGVRVRLLLQGRIEYRLPHFGTLALHEELLQAGVEVFEYQPGFLHAKLALADHWFTIGSSNIDPFSLLLAREANVIVRDPALATALRACIERAIAEGGKPVRWSHIVARPWWVRAAAIAAAFVLRVGVALSGRGLRY
jgi:cardiolipin synthase